MRDYKWITLGQAVKPVMCRVYLDRHGPSKYGVLSDHKINRIDELLPSRYAQAN
jgi:hypothetical protein